jgi:Ca-activated chloride channel family protein
LAGLAQQPGRRSIEGPQQRLQVRAASSGGGRQQAGLVALAQEPEQQAPPGAPQQPGWRRVEPQQPQQAPPTAPQQPDETPVFRAETAWVRVDAQVWEKQRILPGLTRDDFVIYDEGRPQPVAYFGHDSDPVDVLLLLDVSGSMRRYLEDMARTAREALQQLHPRDRVGIMLFSREAKIDQELTADFAKVEAGLKDAVRRQDLGSGTRIIRAVVAAAEYIGKQRAPATDGAAAPRPGRRAVLIVTDNMSMDYQMPDEQAIRALLDADTVLNAIVVGRGERPEPPKPGTYVNPDFNPADVFHVAEESGGVALTSKQAGAAFRSMLESIRARYSLQYHVPEDARPGTFRSIRVELSREAKRRHPNATVLARSGYVVR